MRVIVPTVMQRPKEWADLALKSVRDQKGQPFLISDKKQIGKAWVLNSVLAFWEHDNDLPEFFGVLDDDDYLLPHALRVFQERIESDPNIAWVSSDFMTIDAQGRERYRSSPAPLKTLGGQFGSGFKVYRSNAVLAVGGFCTWSYGLDDYGMCNRLLEHGYEGAHIDTRLFAYRQHEGQITQSRSLMAYRKRARAWLTLAPSMPPPLNPEVSVGS